MAPSGDPTPSGVLPAPPSLGGALRAGASDLFFNSWRIVPANLLVGLGLALAAWAWVVAGVVVAAVVAVVVALPLAGLFRLGAMATRARDVNLSDALDPARQAPLPILAAGAGFSLATLVLATNLASGILVGGVIPWVVATTAAWGLLALVAYAFAFWPLAVDPDRDGVPWRNRARLAGLLLLAYPARLASLTLVLALVLAASTVLFAALVTVSVGFCALVACRYVLPAADRLEARMAAARPARPADPGIETAPGA
jgi:hypothetical protein